MTKSNPNAKKGKLRGTKVLLAGLAVAATVTGWGWLTNQETALGEQMGDNSGRAASQGLNSTQSASRDISGAFRFKRRDAGSLPDLSSLPVRGLRSAPNSTGNSNNGTGQRVMPSAGTSLSPQLGAPSQQSVPQVTTRRKTRSSR